MRGSIVGVVLLAAMAASPVHAQTDLVGWAQLNGTGATAGAAPVVAPNPSGTSLTFFPTRVDFDTAFPVAGQICEDFEDGNIADGVIIGFPAPLDSTTDSAEFPLGSIVAGLVLQDNPLNDVGGGSVNGLVGIGATAFGTPSDIVLANTFVDSLDLLIASGTTAVAIDVFSFTAGATATVSYFDVSDNLLGNMMIGASPTPGAFVGVSSTVPIGRINIDSGAGSEAEGADNICFSSSGAIALPPPQEIPALSGFGFVALATLLLGLAAFSLRRRSVR